MTMSAGESGVRTMKTNPFQRKNSTLMKASLLCALVTILLAAFVLSGCLANSGGTTEEERASVDNRAKDLIVEAALPVTTYAASVDELAAAKGELDVKRGDQTAVFEDGKLSKSRCPYDLDGADLVDRNTESNATSWTFASQANTDALVEEVLDQSNKQGFELVQATSLNLDGTAWGCVVMDAATDSVYLVTVSEASDNEGFPNEKGSCCVVVEVNGSDEG